METKPKLTRQQNIIKMAITLGLVGKHAGSKPLQRIVDNINNYEVK